MDSKKLRFFVQLLETLALFGLCLIGFWVASLLINDEIDRKVLLFINPNEYIPIIDGLMVGITDFSMIIFGVSLVVWEFGYIHYKLSPAATGKIMMNIKIIGLILGVILISMTWWMGYVLYGIFIPMGLAVLGWFWWMSTTYTRFDPKYLDLLHRVVMVTCLAAILSVVGEAIIKNIVQRPRPLNDVNAGWNYAIVLRPDEITRGGYSFYSGHSSGLFAALTPLIWAVKKRPTKCLLFLWAALHAFSRIYLAAHFPYCVLMGSLAGILWGTITIKMFQP